MKRRRNLLVVLLLVCAIGLGVGYANVSGQLTLNSKATVGETTFDVVFTSATLKDKVGTAVALADCTTDCGDQELTLNLTGFTKKDDKAVVEVVVTNNHEFAVKISDVGINPEPGDLLTPDGNPYFTYAIDGIADDDIILAGKPKTFTVTITCNSQNHLTSAQTEDFKLTFTATANKSNP